MESANRTGLVHYRTAAVGGVNVFYREAGPDSAPVHRGLLGVAWWALFLRIRLIDTSPS
jgi:hypothetical protein